MSPLANQWGSTMEEHSPRHPDVQGSSLTNAARCGRDNMEQICTYPLIQ